MRAIRRDLTNLVCLLIVYPVCARELRHIHAVTGWSYPPIARRIVSDAVRLLWRGDL